MLSPPASAICQLTASELLRRMAMGQLSSAEVTEAHIDRIEQVNPQLNAVVIERFSDARREAGAADNSRAAGAHLGLLHGLPITIKECFHLAGTQHTIGVPRLRGDLAKVDSPVVQRLRTAGAIVLGKTNLPQLMLMHETDNPVYGRTNNPRNLDRAPGGSSGGEAAIVAAGGSALGLGNDLGGSVRQPAHSCGICGLKPTSGRLTNEGTRLSLPGMRVMAVQSGPLTRSVEDLDLAMRVLVDPAGPQWDEAPVEWPDFRSVDVASLRIGVWNDDRYFAPSPAVSRAVDEAAGILRDRGAKVETIDPPDAAWAVRLYFGLLSADNGDEFKRVLGSGPIDCRVSRLLRVCRLPRWLRRPLSGVLHGVGRAHLAHLLDHVGGRSTDSYWQLARELIDYRRAVLQMLDDQQVDALLFPPHALPALTHGSTAYLPTAASYCFVANLLGVPAGVVPVTQVRSDETSSRAESLDPVTQAARKADQNSRGLPVGVQVLARHWREDIVLAVMQAIEAGRERMTSIA